MMKTNQSRLALLPNEKLTIISLYFAIAVVTVLCFAASTLMGQQYLVLAGLGLMAYVLGLRHGVDADHIAAIDNTTRKLLQDGKRPLTVGTWFSLGHSTIVIAMTLALVVAGKTVLASLPSLQSAGSIIGTLVSGVFLFAIGLINVVIVHNIYKIFSGLRQEKLSEAQLEDALNKKGFMNKTFGKLFDIVKSPWQMYAVGFLFGLGFDTATEVALIAISVGIGISSNIPIWTVLVLPLMFTAGMVVVDTSDGISMRLAYGWAFLKPIRKIYYNLTITIISVLVAFLIGGIELIQVFSNELRWTGGLWSIVNSLNFETMGYGIVAIFIISWLIAMTYYEYKGFEEKTISGYC